MPPTPIDIIEQIHGGTLLPARRFADLDCDAILDARDSDPKFEQEWLAAREHLARKWKASRPSRAAKASVEDLRRESFLAVSTATGQHELSSYVSDDFELIGWASAVGELPPVVAWLWESYAAGTIPRPDRRGG
jgi:predicted DsbA family dithiol-disulfide isomerase